MSQSHEVSFEALRDAVTVTYDENTETVTTTVSGSSSTVFVGTLEPMPEVEVVVPEPIIDAPDSDQVGETR